MANPNAQLQSAISQFVAQPGITPDKKRSSDCNTIACGDYALMTAPYRLTLLAFALLALSACAHSTTQPASMPAKETAAMDTTSPDGAGNYRPHTLDEFPELTPDEMGKRFLKLIESLKSFDELSPERLQKVMRVHLTPSPQTHGGFFTIRLPESNWYYGLSYYNDPMLSENKNATYQFINRPAGQDDNDDRADMSPVCGMDFNAYVSELKKMGFVEREDLAQYDSPMPPTNMDGTMEEREFFRLPVYIFTRGSIKVGIHERREADAPDDKSHHACVESISVSRYGR